MSNSHLSEKLARAAARGAPRTVAAPLCRRIVAHCCVSDVTGVFTVDLRVRLLCAFCCAGSCVHWD